MKNKFLILFISLIIYLTGFLFSYDYIMKDLLSGPNRLNSVRSLLEYGIMYISFIVFCVLLWKSKFVKFLSLLLILLIGVNSFISYCCYFVYGSGFNIGMALSVIDSNLNEAMNMIKDYVFPLFITLIFIALNIYLVVVLSKNRINKKYKFFSVLWIILPLFFLMKHHLIGTYSGSPMFKSIFYHFKDFKSAFVLQNRLSRIINNKIKYNFNQNHKPLETIVILIGESGRSQNMSLYGYKRNTTPYQLKEKENMYLFENANSPAGITNLSLPLTLSRIEPENYDIKTEDIADNIVNLSNNYGYNTYWLSTQNNIKGVTEIASYSKVKKWVNGYDLELLPMYREVLNEKGKKLIVLHINGSHPNPCLRYPDDESHFVEEGLIDCYDNSIRYTDKLIGVLLSDLRNKNTAFIYFSDHGLKMKNDKVIHTDSQESSKVPFYIWFGNNEDKISYNFSKKINEPVSIAYLYPIIMNLIGLKEENLPKVIENKYLMLDHSTIFYSNLK